MSLSTYSIGKLPHEGTRPEQLLEDFTGAVGIRSERPCLRPVGKLEVIISKAVPGFQQVG